MRYLAAVDTVHTAAAICDYLQGRVDEGDAVRAVVVHPPADGERADGAAAGEADSADGERDRREALNVVSVRLVVPTVETTERRGEPGPELLAAAEDHGVDELVLGARAGTPGTPDGLGSTLRAVLDATTRPVAVVPLVGS